MTPLMTTTAKTFLDLSIRTNDLNRIDQDRLSNSVCTDKDKDQERYAPRHHDLMGASTRGYLAVTSGRSAGAGDRRC